MPLKHTRTFRVRYYECDAQGHLNNANYLRYMQETAFDASAEAGYDLRRYEQMERLWLIRESQVEFLRPLRYNDRVAVTTWIVDFRRVTSRRAYEFHLPENGELVARAWTDWVFLDTHDSRPARIPEELIASFFPEGYPQVDPERSPYPTPPPPPAGVFATRRRVSWQETDAMQHVNNACYVVYASDCSFQTMAAFGWPWQRMQALGLGIFLRRLRVQYLLPAKENDTLEIATWVYDVRRSTAIRHYTLRRVEDNALLAQVNTYSVWVSLQTGQPVRIPASMLADFAPNITV